MIKIKAVKDLERGDVVVTAENFKLGTVRQVTFGTIGTVVWWYYGSRDVYANDATVNVQTDNGRK